MRNMKKALSRAVIASSIQGTTTKDANRKRYSSGIFLSQIPFKSRLSKFGLVSFIEFAIRATLRTKAHLRTNKGGSSLAVVEPLSHLTSDNLLTKTKERNPTMKTRSKIYRTFSGSFTHTYCFCFCYGGGLCVNTA